MAVRQGGRARSPFVVSHTVYFREQRLPSSAKEDRGGAGLEGLHPSWHDQEGCHIQPNSHRQNTSQCQGSQTAKRGEKWVRCSAQHRYIDTQAVSAVSVCRYNLCRTCHCVKQTYRRYQGAGSGGAVSGPNSYLNRPYPLHGHTNKAQQSGASDRNVMSVTSYHGNQLSSDSSQSIA